MKHILPGMLLAAAVSLATTAVPAFAEETVKIPAPTQTIDLPAHRYPMARQDFDDFRGAYELSNGQTLYLTHNGIAMYAEIDRQGTHRIVAASPDSFVALDRQLKMRIDLKQDGTVGGELTMVVPRKQFAGSDEAPQQEVIVYAFH